VSPPVRQTDVLVVGAGPAGAVTALLCARAGLRVRLLDRAEFPRDKLCGDTVNPGALEILRRLGLAAAIDRHALPIRGMVVSGVGGVRVAAEYGAGVHGLSILRRDLDWLLVQAAVAAGVQFEPATSVDAPLVETSTGERRVVGVRVRRAGGSESVLAPLTIGADGRRSRLATQLGLAHQPMAPRRWAIGAYFEGVEVVPGFGEMHIRPQRYIGLAPVPGGSTNACVVVSEPRHGALADPAALLMATLRNDPEVGRRFGGARPATVPSVLGPLAIDCAAPGMPGLLLAGDAAGFIDPMTGDGIRLALTGAELAAEVALAHLDGRLADPAGALARRRGRAFGRKSRLNRLLRALVASPGAVSWAARGAKACPPLVRTIIRTAGDVGMGGS
jgi:menaquinone-9 beta-reductase